MIDLYTGTPGSGKSLHCAKEIYSRICRGQNVFANFDINESLFYKKRRRGNFAYIDNSELNPDLLIAFAVGFHKRNTNGHIVEGQTLLVIDECQILFNAREWQAKDRMKWATFFTQHRKYGYNVILITQFDRLIDRQIRSLVENEVIHRKASNFKTIGFFLGLAFRGNIFCAITKWYGLNEKMYTEWFVLRKKYASLYDSYKIFSPQMVSGVQGPRKPAEVEKAEAKPPEQISVAQLLVDEEIKQNLFQSAKKCYNEPTEGYSSLKDFWLTPPLN